jgi:hypothetical protein
MDRFNNMLRFMATIERIVFLGFSVKAEHVKESNLKELIFIHGCYLLHIFSIQC